MALIDTERELDRLADTGELALVKTEFFANDDVDFSDKPKYWPPYPCTPWFIARGAKLVDIAYDDGEMCKISLGNIPKSVVLYCDDGVGRSGSPTHEKWWFADKQLAMEFKLRFVNAP